MNFFLDRISRYRNGNANYLLGDPIGTLLRRSATRGDYARHADNTVRPQIRALTGRLHFYAIPNRSLSLNEEKYMCRVLDCFYDVFEQVDSELKVDSTCDHDQCLCNSAIVAVIKTANLKLNDFRKKLVDWCQHRIFDGRAQRWTEAAKDCVICYENVEQYIRDRERHVLRHPVCRSCFVTSGRRTCPCCRHSMRFAREVNDFLTQMELIDKAVIDNDEWIDYLSTSHTDA